MLTLILAISLGLLLLFVIFLLVTEVAATYPVWKQFNQDYSSYPAGKAAAEPGEKKRRSQKPVFLAMGILCFIVVIAAVGLWLHEPAPALKEQKTAPALQHHVLSAHSADYAIFFSLQTKWESGRLYGNCTATFHTDTAKPPADCRLYLLDKDGFLVKAVSLGAADFVLESPVNSPSRKMMGRFHTELSIDDYLKVEKLQVAVEGKVPEPRSPGG